MGEEVVGSSVVKVQYLLEDEYETPLDMTDISAEDLLYDMRRVSGTYANLLMSLADAHTLQVNASRALDTVISTVNNWIQNNVNHTSSQDYDLLQSSLQQVVHQQKHLLYYRQLQ